MATFRVHTNKGKFDVEASNPTEAQAVAARRLQCAFTVSKIKRVKVT